MSARFCAALSCRHALSAVRIAEARGHGEREARPGAARASGQPSPPESEVDLQRLARGVSRVGLDQGIIDALFFEPGEEEVPPFVRRHRARNARLGCVAGQHFAHAPIRVLVLAHGLEQVDGPFRRNPAGVVYTYWVYLTWLPGYLETSRHLSILKTGFVAAIPYLVGIIGVPLGGLLSDWLLKRGIAPINARRIPIIVGTLISRSRLSRRSTCPV